jgi:CDGSH-type Zn-finger protein
VGSSFKPIKFSLDQKTDTMHLCGCKLTSNAPFCDGKTCKCLADGENFDGGANQE